MSNWTVIEVSDLEDYCVAAQVEALQESALGDSQDNPFPRVMAAVADRVRNKCKKLYEVSATPNSVPPELKWAACYLILAAMQTRIPGLELTQEQKDQITSAEKELNRVEDGDSVITNPDDPLPNDAQSNASVTVVSSSTRNFTREKMTGL